MVDLARQNVAPFAGAWIEIDLREKVYDRVIVAPFAGAWIEILVISPSSSCGDSRSLRGSVD